jgi:hypothetical protein
LFRFRIICDLDLTPENFADQSFTYVLDNGITIDLNDYFGEVFILFADLKEADDF